MHRILHAVASVLLLIWSGHAQTSQAKPAPNKVEVPTPATPKAEAAPNLQELQEYPLPADRRAQIRELQFSSDQLQIKIEQMKAQQAVLLEDILHIATEAARVKGLDPALYDVDQVNLRLLRKKAAPVVAPPSPAPPQGKP